MPTGDGTSSDELELLARMTARLASTASLPGIVDTVLDEIVSLGFAAVWMAVLDEPTATLVTVKEVMEGVDTTHEMPAIPVGDVRQPIGRGFAERRVINIVDPDALRIIDRDDDTVPDDGLALPRAIYDHMRGNPFACGPLLGSSGRTVGAFGLSSYLGRRPIPDELLSRGILRAFLDHLGIAMERALFVAQLERLNADLVRAHAATVRDARVEAVGELAAAVAHDLNNLTGIALMAASIGTRSPDDAVEVLPRIERANRAIGDLVGRLQRAARPQIADRDRADLAQIVDDIAAMVDPLLREQSIALRVDVATRLPAVRCDPVLVHQIVLNLVMNAQDALARVTDTDRRIDVTAWIAGDTVRLTVRDTGPGVAADMLGRLFQPFVTDKGEGHLGLGLSAVHASLEHFGGTITGQNVASGGAAFEVVFARAAAHAAAVVAAPAPRSRRARVLAIDDDPDITEIIREYLEPLGYEVHTSARGDDALALARAQPFDVILCDVGMPQRNGLDVCSMLRAAGYRGKLILMTGWDSCVVNSDRRAAQADRMLQKPFVGHELRQLLDSLVS